MFSRLEKIQYLDKLFGSKKRYTLKELTQRFDEESERRGSTRKGLFSPRTIQSYMQELKTYEPPLKAQPNKTKFGEAQYFYEHDFSLTTDPIKKQHVQELKSLYQLVKQFEGLPHADDLRDFIALIEARSQLKTADAPSHISLERHPPVVGQEWMPILHQHIESKTVLELSYQPFNKTAQMICMHPYHLKVYQRYWHLIGWNESKGRMENYALDRIKKIKLGIGVLYRPCKINFNTYFDDIIGVTKFEQYAVEKYRLKVSLEIAPYWEHRPLHHSQKCIEATEDYSIFEFQLRWNYEWQNLILHYGKNAEVLEPIEFRQQIQQILQESLNRYL